MVIDTSALVLVLRGEEGFFPYADAIAESSVRLVSVATVLEATMVLEGRQGLGRGAQLDLFIHRTLIDVRVVDLDQLEAARGAFRRYGKGRHPAALNFGDCFSYALAKTAGEPLLFKGTDFALTDVQSALR